MITNLDNHDLETITGGSHCKGFSLTLGDFAYCFGVMTDN